MKRIEEIKSMDVHISFEPDGRFSYCFNSEEADEDGTAIPLDQLRIIARTLSRIAVCMWHDIDNAYLKEK